MDLTSVKLNQEKEIQAVKINTRYHGIILCSEEIFITSDSFDSPLKAANYARKLRKENKIEPCVKKNQKALKVEIKPKITETYRLLTEAEVAGHTRLNYREIWVIVSPTGEFVKETLKKGAVVRYDAEKDNAQTFKTYEDAITMVNTLNCVVQCGHYLKRFFIENKK